MPIKLNSAGGGSVTLDTPSTASAYTLTVPAITGTAVVTGSTGTVSQAMIATNVAGKGPAFAAYGSAFSSISNNIFTKLPYDTVIFDTNSNYSTGNNRFTPTIAGYYQVSLNGAISSAAAGGGFIAVLKNGASATYGSSAANYTGGNTISSISVILYMNGSTDYIEPYGYQSSGGNLNVGSNGSQYVFSAALVRAA